MPELEIVVSLNPESLAAERERLAPAFAYVDRHADEFVERLLRLVRMPSVSAHEQQLPETADMVEAMARAAGAETEQIPLDGGPPLVYGKVAGTGPRTLLLYNHYDVQPADPLELWQSEPFAPEVRAGRIWGRGVSDNKGNLVARLCALEAYRADAWRVAVDGEPALRGRGGGRQPAPATAHGLAARAGDCSRWTAASGRAATPTRPAARS